MKSITGDAIYVHLQANNILRNEQFGFWPGDWCNLQLLEVLQFWSPMVDKGGGYDVQYFDYSKKCI